jgi:uncharacterized protein DUF5658
MVTTDPIRDESGRVIAPPQVVLPPRPMGPWTQNGDKVKFRIALMLACVLSPLVAQAQERPSHAFHAVLGSYVALRTVDFAQTSSCVFNGGCVELNPVFRSLVSRPALFTIAQAGITTGIATALWKLHHQHPKLAFVLTGVLVGTQAVVVTSNARQLRQIR